jgi:hypothetical protein
MPDSQIDRAGLLNPRDIIQVAFLVEDDSDGSDIPETTSSAANAEKRFIIGQLNVQWRSTMGDKGSITTGWLTGKKR